MLLLSLSGVTKDVVDNAKQAVSSSVETAKEAFQNSVDVAKNLAGIDTDADTDTEEPESDDETPRDGVGITTIDADSEPDNVITDDADADELPNYLERRKEYVFEFSEPRLTPTEYLEQDRHEGLAAWAIANANSEEYNGMQFAITYRVIRDGEVFDTSRRRTQRLSFGSELRLEEDLRAKVRDLERIARQDYDNIFLDNHAVIVTQTDT